MASSNEMSDHLYVSFLDKAQEWVLELEDNILALERHPWDGDLTKNMFRVVHNIKGSSSVFGLGDICRFSHTLEEVLDLVQQGNLNPGEELINAFIRATDLIREMIDAAFSKSFFDFSKCDAWVRDLEDSLIEE